MANESQRSASDGERLRSLGAEISNTRDELSGLVAELDRRRHRLFDFKAQIKDHIVGISITGAALAAISATVIGLAVKRAHRRARFVSRTRQIPTAVSRMLANPELVATGPTTTRKLLTAVAAAALGSATRTVVANVVQNMMEAARQGASGSPRPLDGRVSTRQWQGDGAGRPNGDDGPISRETAAGVGEHR